MMNQETGPIGPYWSYTGRMDWLNDKLRSYGTLCAEAVVEGDYDRARYWALKWEVEEKSRQRCNARYEATKGDKAVESLGWDAAYTYGRVTA